VIMFSIKPESKKSAPELRRIRHHMERIVEIASEAWPSDDYWYSQAVAHLVAAMAMLEQQAVAHEEDNGDA